MSMQCQAVLCQLLLLGAVCLSQCQRPANPFPLFVTPPAHIHDPDRVPCQATTQSSDPRLWCNRYRGRWGAAPWQHRPQLTLASGHHHMPRSRAPQCNVCPEAGIIILHRFCGRTGNNFLQYTFARILAEEMGFALLTPPLLPWDPPTYIVPTSPIRAALDPDVQLGLGMSSMADMRAIACNCTPRCIELSGIALNEVETLYSHLCQHPCLLPTCLLISALP